MSELIGIYAILVGLGFLFTGRLGFTDMAVHPFWLPVLAMSAQYGLGWGIVAATAGTAIHVFSLHVGLNIVERASIALDDAGQLAAAWLVAAAFVGACRDRLNRRFISANEARAQAVADCDRLSSFAKTQAQEIAELRIALLRTGRAAAPEAGTSTAVKTSPATLQEWP